MTAMSWTAADLLSRCKALAMRPSLDLDMSDADWYELLSLAQEHWYTTFSVHCPDVLFGAPAKMTTSDGGYTYQFPSSVFALAAELKTSPTGSLMIAGSDWDPYCDFVPEGDQIRIPNGRTRTFGNGPYARYITPPAAISASSEPTLKPTFARILLVYHALTLFALRGGMLDPAPYQLMEQKAWIGDPSIGDTGIIGTLKKQYFGRGMAAVPGEGTWYRSPDLGQ